MTRETNIVAAIGEQVGRVNDRSGPPDAREQVDLWVSPDGRVSVLPRQLLDTRIGLYCPAVLERYERALTETGFTKVALTIEPGRDAAIEVYGKDAQKVKAALEACRYQVTRAEAALPERARPKLIDALETLKRDHAAGKIDQEYAHLVYGKVAQLAGTVNTSDAIRIRRDVGHFLEGKLDAVTAAKRTVKAQLAFHQEQRWIKAGARRASAH